MLFNFLLMLLDALTYTCAQKEMTDITVIYTFYKI